MRHVFYRPIYGIVPRAYNGTFKPRVNKEALYSFFTFLSRVFKIIHLGEQAKLFLKSHSQE